MFQRDVLSPCSLLRAQDVRQTRLLVQGMKATSTYSKKCIDLQESIVEPLHGKNKMPYYHRELSRVPEIDDCGVNDKVHSNRKRDFL